jgi:hypothetical protein
VRRPRLRPNNDCINQLSRRHLEAGFAVVFAEDIGDVALDNPVPDAWNNLCPIYNQQTRMFAAYPGLLISNYPYPHSPAAWWHQLSDADVSEPAAVFVSDGGHISAGE